MKPRTNLRLRARLPHLNGEPLRRVLKREALVPRPQVDERQRQREEGVDVSEVVAIVGSRDFPDMQQVRAYVRTLEPGTTVISGGARGVDRVAADEARLIGLDVREFHADWKRLGKGAGLFRNRTIAEECTRMVAFWDSESRGTQHAIACARSLNRPVLVLRWHGGKRGDS